MKIVKRIQAFFILLKADRELKRAINQADRLHLRTGRRYYVLPNTHHELRAWCWADIKRMRQAGLFSHRARGRVVSPPAQAETPRLAELCGAGTAAALKKSSSKDNFSNLFV